MPVFCNYHSYEGIVGPKSLASEEKTVAVLPHRGRLLPITTHLGCTKQGLQRTEGTVESA